MEVFTICMTYAFIVMMVSFNLHIKLVESLLIGESGAKSNTGELWQYLDNVLMLGVYIHNIVEQLDKLAMAW